MKKIVMVMMVFLLIGCQTKDGPSQVESTIDDLLGPYYLTSIGQSVDYVLVKGVLKQLNIEFEHNPLMTDEQLNEGTLLMTTGISRKGMENVGLTLDEEVSRAKALIEKAYEKDLNVVIIHLGGEERRGKESDALIEIMAEAAHMMLVLSEGNYDDFFDDLSEVNDVPLMVVDGIDEVSDIFEELFE